jgi:hypothetical protein
MAYFHYRQAKLITIPYPSSEALSVPTIQVLILLTEILFFALGVVGILIPLSLVGVVFLFLPKAATSSVTMVPAPGTVANFFSIRWSFELMALHPCPENGSRAGVRKMSDRAPRVAATIARNSAA